MTIAANTTKLPGFISPFIRTLAVQENISNDELLTIQGSGLDGRITKDDIIAYLNKRDDMQSAFIVKDTAPETSSPVNETPMSADDGEYIPLTRLRKLIAAKMVASKKVSPHVTSFVEVNISRLVSWRQKIRPAFQNRYGENLTYTPLFIEAVVSALKQFPTINAAIQGDFLLVKKNINIGIATALPDGNLIVPVIKNAQNLDLAGLALKISDLARRAKIGNLKPDEIQGGTFTITNVGSFGNIGGTPIINQPELAILAIGSIVKKPVAVETGTGYGIAVQDIIELWLSYDHRVVDGALGGSFLKCIADNMNDFDDSRTV